MRRGTDIAFTASDRGERQEASVSLVTAQAREALEEAAAAAAAAAEQAYSVAEVLDEALAILAEAEAMSTSAPAIFVAPESVLSPREREVLALVAEGRSNRAIAEALYLSPNTVKTHVASLMNKLDAGSRAHLAAIATRQKQDAAAGRPLAS
jgi:DNA-binding NarL/FixJ family response regulator